MRKSRHMRPFYRLLISLLAALILPSVILSASYSAALRWTVMEDYIALNRQSAENAGAVIDSYVTSHLNSAYALAGTPSVKQLAANIDMTTLDRNNACRDLNNYLSGLQIGNPIFSFTGVYFPDRELVVSSSSTMLDYGLFYSLYLKFSGVTAEELASKLTAAKSAVYYAGYSTGPAMEAAPAILFMQVIDLGYLDSRACFFSLIRVEEFAQLIQNSFDSRIRFVVEDVYGNVLFRSDSEIAPEYAGTDYHAFSYSGLSSGLKYLFFLPTTSVFGQASLFQTIYFLSLALCTLIGVWLSVRMARNLYGPFEQMANTAFPGSGLPDAPNMRVGFKLVEGKIRENQLRSEQFQREIQQQYRVIRDNALLRLLSRSHLLSEEDLMSAADICSFSHTAFFRVAIVENPSGRLTVPPELCEENGCSVVATQLSESQQIVVLSAPADLLARMEELLPSWLEIPQAQYAAGISKTHSLRSLSRCMLEATDAFQLSSAGNAQILSYGDMPDAFTAMEFPPEKELQLIASVRAGDDNETERLLREIYATNQQERKLSTDALWCLYSSLFSTALKASGQIPGAQEAFMEESHYLISILQSHSIKPEICFSELLRIFHTLCESAQQSMHSKNRRIIDQVMDYLNEQYANPMLCLDMVADHLGVSYYFLSRMFKDETGESFSDILNAIRVDCAITLLLNTDLPVQSISERVGYTNRNTFLRAFQKRTGTTPLRYRKENAAQPRP